MVFRLIFFSFVQLKESQLGKKGISQILQVPLGGYIEMRFEKVEKSVDIIIKSNFSSNFTHHLRLLRLILNNEKIHFFLTTYSVFNPKNPK